MIESWVLNPNVLSSVDTRAGFCLHPARTVNVVRCIYSTQQDVELYRKGVLRLYYNHFIFFKKGKIGFARKTLDRSMGNVRIYRSATKSRLVSFSSDCLRKWRDFSGPITKKSKAKAKPKLKPKSQPAHSRIIFYYQ